MRGATTRRITGIALSLLLAATPATAQLWPAKPIKTVVPIAAGSLTDVVPRLVLESVGKQLGQPVVVENRPGAGGTIGTLLVAKAPADGYTLLAPSSAHTIAPALHPALGYDAARDFAAVAPLGVAPFVLVVAPGRGIASVDALVAAARAKPDALTFSSPGIGTASHLSAELFQRRAGIQALHVPFKGGVEAMTEVIAGRVDFFFMAMGAALPHIRDGKLTALAVNGPARAAALPQVPTLREAGLDGADNPTWFGLFLPSGTAREIVDALHRAVVHALQDPALKARLVELGVEPMAMTPRQFDAYVVERIAADGALVQALGLKAQ